jgi:tetratricopeptide (TPR) repeat protein
MDPTTECRKWLETFPRFNWRSTFDFLLAPETLKAVEFNDYGIACFTKGFHSEFVHKNYQEAFNWYENGAMQYDPLCLFRLHEIYIGNTAFQVEYNERQALCHLIYSALLSQFEHFDHKVTFWQKFEAFWKKNTEKANYIQELILNPSADYFHGTGPLFSKLFAFYCDKKSFMEILPELKALSTDTLKNKFFGILNAVFDFIAHTYNPGYSKSDLEQYVAVILDMLTNDLLFDNFFHNYLTHLKILRARKRFAVVFQRRLETNCFWIWSFSFLASMKNHYLGLLIAFDETFTDGSLVLKWKNTSSWVNNFIGFCAEKGIGTQKDQGKSIELYEKDIEQMPRVLFSRYRRVMILKQTKGEGSRIGQEGDLESYIESEVKDMKVKLAERLEDSTRMDCYLYYTYGKIYEKLDGDMDAAIDWYQKGVNADTDSCMKNHLLCNESWRMKCKKRLQKLQKRKGLQVMIINKNYED